MKTLVLTAQQTHSNVAALSWYNVEVTFILQPSSNCRSDLAEKELINYASATINQRELSLLNTFCMSKSQVAFSDTD